MKKLFWIDMEMSGLNEDEHHILEIAAIVTNLDLQALDQFHCVVFQPPSILARMDEWCVKTHGASGLTAAIPNGIPLEDADARLLEFANRHFKSNDRIVLVGNTVNQDKRFIDRYLPRTARRLHYRVIDVSSFKEIFRQKYGVKVEKNSSHRAVDDINESILELKTYLSYFRVPGPNQS